MSRNISKGVVIIYFPAVTEGFSAPSVASLYFTDRYLFTIYPFLKKKRPESLIKYVMELYPDKQVMVDSGVYSLMYKNQLIEEDDLILYTHQYLEMLDRLNFKGILIEVDSQYIEEEYGTIDTLRTLYPEYGVEDRVLYVWHFAEGLDALWGLMEKYKRIALSPKELWMYLKDRKQQKEYKSKALNLFKHMQKRSDNHHFHLLGTMLDWTAHLPHNWTCDASSWTSGLVWGFYFLDSPFGFDFRGEKENVSPAIKRKVDEAMPELLRIYENVPRFHKKKAIREDALYKMSISMLSMVEWFKAETLRRFGDYPIPNDPINFKGKG